MRRWMLVLLTILVGGTSFGLTAYVRLHRPLERADVKNLECDLIDEQGEYYFGELQDCRNRLAYLRVVERAEAKQPRSLDSSTAVP